METRKDPRYLAIWPLLAVLLVAQMQTSAADVLICKTAPKGSKVTEPPITVWGQETLIAFGSGFRAYQGALPGVEGPWLAPVITGLVLTLISLYMVISGPGGPLKDQLLYWTITFYPFATGIVEFARFNFDASRFGFLTASWHNLPEYVLINFLFRTRQGAVREFPKVLTWVWFVDILIMFVPAFMGDRGVVWAGLFEQLTGICCDIILLVAFLYLYFSTNAGDGDDQAARALKLELKGTYRIGLFAAFLHLLEIVPLVILLSGIVPRPFLPVCILVAFSSPITFYFYHRFANLWIGEAGGATNAKTAIPRVQGTKILGVSISIGVFLILGPQLLIPPCLPSHTSGVSEAVASLTGGKVVLPGSNPVLPESAGIAAASVANPTAAPAPSRAHDVPKSSHSLGGPMCVDGGVISGIQSFTAAPGKAQALQELITAAAPRVRSLKGCLRFDVYMFDDGQRLQVQEQWASLEDVIAYENSGVVQEMVGTLVKEKLAANFTFWGPRSQAAGLAPCCGFFHPVGSCTDPIDPLQDMTDRNQISQGLLQTLAGFDMGDWSAYSGSLHPKITWETYGGDKLVSTAHGIEELHKQFNSSRVALGASGLITQHLLIGTYFVVKTPTYAHTLSRLAVENYKKGEAAPMLEIPSWYEDQLVLGADNTWKLFDRKLKIMGCPEWMIAAGLCTADTGFGTFPTELLAKSTPPGGSSASTCDSGAGTGAASSKNPAALQFPSHKDADSKMLVDVLDKQEMQQRTLSSLFGWDFNNTAAWLAAWHPKATQETWALNSSGDSILVASYTGHEGLTKQLEVAKRDQAAAGVTTFHLFTGTVYLEKSANFAHLVTRIPVELYAKGKPAPSLDVPAVYEDFVVKTADGWQLVLRQLKIQGCPVYLQRLCGEGGVPPEVSPVPLPTANDTDVWVKQAVAAA